MRESVFEIAGPDGLIRRGILVEPTGKITCLVMLLPAGLKYHVGPHRLNVKLARRLAACGYAVARIDPLGLGESDGVLGPAPTRALWRGVEQGAFVEDVLLAARALRKKFGDVPVVLGGLCGGAVTAQFAAAIDPIVVRGVISIATAVTLSAAEGEQPAKLSGALARHNLRGYFRKLRSRDAWLRILRGESDFRGIGRTLKTMIRSQFGRRSETVYPNENPRFMQSFRKLQAAGVEHLLLFGTNDNRWVEFQAAALRPRLNGEMLGPHYAIQTVPDANHELHFREWQQRAMLGIVEWLGRHFPIDAAAIESLEEMKRGLA